MTRLLGVTDDVTTCDCCGRKGLKSTVALDMNGDVVYYGCDCAAVALGRNERHLRDSMKTITKIRNYFAKLDEKRAVLWTNSLGYYFGRIGQRAVLFTNGGKVVCDWPAATETMIDRFFCFPEGAK